MDWVREGPIVAGWIVPRDARNDPSPTRCGVAAVPRVNLSSPTWGSPFPFPFALAFPSAVSACGRCVLCPPPSRLGSWPSLPPALPRVVATPPLAVAVSPRLHGGGARQARAPASSFLATACCLGPTSRGWVSPSGGLVGGVGGCAVAGACRCVASVLVPRPCPASLAPWPSALGRRAVSLSLSRRRLPASSAACLFHPNGLSSSPVRAQRGPRVVVPEVPCALRSGWGSLLPPCVQGLLELPQGPLQPLESPSQSPLVRGPRLLPLAVARVVALIPPPVALSSALLRRFAPRRPAPSPVRWRLAPRSSALAFAWGRRGALPSLSAVSWRRRAVRPLPSSSAASRVVSRVVRASCAVVGGAAPPTSLAARAAAPPSAGSGVLRLPDPHAPPPVVGAGSCCAGGVLGLVPRRCVRRVPAHACLPTEVDRLRRVSRVDGVPEHALPRIGRYPWGSAPSRSQGFWLAPRGPPEAEVLREGQAVIAWRACCWLGDELWCFPVGCTRRRGLSGRVVKPRRGPFLSPATVRSCPRVGLRPGPLVGWWFAPSADPGVRVVVVGLWVGAVTGWRPGVLGLPDALPLLPVVAGRFGGCTGGLARLPLVRTLGWARMAFLRLGLLRFLPTAHLGPSCRGSACVDLVPEVRVPRLPQPAPGLLAPRRLEGLVLPSPIGWPVRQRFVLPLAAPLAGGLAGL
jgi:hypothetical protein